MCLPLPSRIQPSCHTTWEQPLPFSEPLLHHPGELDAKVLSSVKHEISVLHMERAPSRLCHADAH